MASALFFAFFASLLIIISIYARDAHAAVNSTINFQARVLTAGGAVVPDGNVNVQFKIYNAATAGTNEWTETQTVAAKNGYITVSLGSVTSFPGTIDWSQEHWLTMNINGDGEMGPTRMKMTAVPYSFRSGQADVLTNGASTLSASGLVQLSPGSTPQATNSTTSAISIKQQGLGGLLQLQGSAGTDVLTVSNSGATVIASTLSVSGASATVGSTTQVGSLILNDGTGKTSSLSSGNLSATTNQAFILPTVGGTLCVQNSTSCGFVLTTNGFINGGNSFGGLASIGTNDANALAFRAGNAEVGRFTSGGNLVIGGGAISPRNSELVDINGSLRSNKFIVGTTPDISVIPIASGQTAITSYFGLQLVGNKQGVVDYTPTNFGLAGDFSVIIPNQQATKIGLVIRGQTSQSGDLQQFQDSTGTVLSKIDASGDVGINTTTTGSNRLTINTPATADTAAQTIIYTNGTANKGLVIQSIAGQNVNTFEVQNNAGTSLVSFDKTGQLVLGNDAATAQAGLITFNDTTAANGFTSVLGTNTLTASRSLNLPDVNGTLLALTPSAAQVDSTTGASIIINKTGASGNIITLQKGGTTTFSVLNSGALQLQLTDTSALNIKNSGGTQYFNVDSSAGLIQIGGATADATGVLLVFDTKNTAGDPTSVEGGEYYNSVNGTFRCSENLRGWTDCLGISKPNTRRSTSIVASGSATTFSVIGGDIVTAVGTATASAATATQSPAINYATTGALNNVTGISGNTNYNSSNNYGYQSYVVLPSTASERVWAGLTNQTLATMGASANPAGIYASFRYDTSAGDTTWRCVTKDNVTQNVGNTGVAVSTSPVKLEIIGTTTNVEFKINGVVVCNNTVNLPPAATMMRYENSLTALAALVTNIRFGWVYVETDF